jgi:hypothetical protein
MGAFQVHPCKDEGFDSFAEFQPQENMQCA